MKRVLSIPLSIAMVVLTMSCVAQKGAKLNKEYTTKSGLKYKVTQKGDGKMAESGKSVKVHYSGKLEDGTEFDSSYKRGKPFTFKLGTGQVIKGWDEGIVMLKEGDKATLTIPAELGYGSQDKGTIPPNSTLIFDVELIQVIQPPKPFDVGGKDTITMESGLKYMKVHTVDNEKQAEAYRTVSVHYSGYLTDGKLFDSSVERGEPITFKLGTGKVIKGWDEGISYLKVGERARFVIPPSLGYGEKGYPPIIPANSTLVFDVELVEVK